MALRRRPKPIGKQLNVVIAKANPIHLSQGTTVHRAQHERSSCRVVSLHIPLPVAVPVFLPLFSDDRIISAWPMAILARAACPSKGGFSEFSVVSGPRPKRTENSCDPASRFGQPRLNRVRGNRIGSDHAAEQQRRTHHEQQTTIPPGVRRNRAETGERPEGPLVRSGRHLAPQIGQGFRSRRSPWHQRLGSHRLHRAEDGRREGVTIWPPAGASVSAGLSLNQPVKEHCNAYEPATRIP